MITFIKAKLLLFMIAVLWLFFIIMFSPFQIPLTIVSKLLGIKKLERYTKGFWMWQDQAVNAILGGNYDISVSSKVGYMSNIENSKTARCMEVVIDWLFRTFIGQERHCYNSIEYDEDHYVKD